MRDAIVFCFVVLLFGAIFMGEYYKDYQRHHRHHVETNTMRWTTNP